MSELKNIMKTEREVTVMNNKTIGYVAPQYYDVYMSRCSEEPPELTALFDEFKREAQNISQPCWPVKNATVLYTYKGKCFVVDPWRMDCTQEVFEKLARSLIDRMYELGAYDMFYTGMLD